MIKIEGAGKERKRLTRAVVLAIRELTQQTEPDSKTRDLAAFIALALLAIDETVDESVTPWEKRGYWLKADRFRLEWAWARRLGEEMREAVISEDWATIAGTAAQVAEKLDHVRLPKRNALGTPWEGAWEQLKKRAES
ncbi:MAG TPA: hypothetical protein VE136_11190 [Anaerolineales bacterium]|nr:hypothetical protein [Anaerolineales bacterium]